MICQEKDVDNEYIARRYDMTILLRNIAGNGGLQLVMEPYFDWGMRVMNIVAKQLTEDDINTKGKKSLAHAKKAILNHSSLKSDFALICNRQEMRDKSLETTYQLFEKVYILVLTKVCNARFGEVLANYSETNHLKNKGKLGIRAYLNGLVNGVTQKEETNNSSDSTAAPIPVPTFAVILLGGNGAIAAQVAPQVPALAPAPFLRSSENFAKPAPEVSDLFFRTARCSLRLPRVPYKSLSRRASVRGAGRPSRTLCMRGCVSPPAAPWPVRPTPLQFAAPELFRVRRPTAQRPHRMCAANLNCRGRTLLATSTPS